MHWRSKMNTTCFKVLLCCWCMSIASDTGAALVPTINLTDLVEEADVVVIGTVIRISDTGPTSIATFNNTVAARRMDGEVVVDQILKGPSGLSSVRFQFSLPTVVIGYRSVRSGSYRILFLKSKGDHYEFVSPYYPTVVAVAGNRLQSERPLDKALEAVVAVLQSPNTSAEYRREAIDALWGLKSPLATSGLRSTLQESDRAVQLHAAAALLAV